MQNSKKAFSFVEIIITISIIVLLAVIGISSKKGYDENINNTMVLSNIETINNALESFAQENSVLPMPGGNINFYTKDTSYVHSYEDPSTFGVYGSITEDTIPKKYLDTLPLDPRTNSYYAYGKTKATKGYELASVQIIDSIATARVAGNYAAETGPYNLIREYNGSNFVYNGSETNLPYNPEELVLIATVNGEVKRQGDIISTGTGETKEIFFSDGSVSILEPESSLTLTELSFPEQDNLNTLVKLSLGAGTIWTRATKLNQDSSFEVYTTDSTAAVRGTIFGVQKDGFSTNTSVIQGTVEVSDSTINKSVINIKDGESITTHSGYTISSPIINTSIIILPKFSNSIDPRGEDTLGNVSNPCTEFVGLGCIQSSPSLTSSGFSLVAYAPYTDNTELFNTDGNDYATATGTFGVSNGNLNATTAGGFLKYEGIDLTGDFAIEIMIRGEALNTVSTNEYLLNIKDSNNNDLIRLNKSLGFLKLRKNLDYLDIIAIPTGSFSSGFQKVIFKKEGDQGIIKVGSNIQVTESGFSSIISTSIDNISIGSYGTLSQWNDIIDYVKIYTKN